MSQLVQPADNKTVVFGGSYIVVNCSSNYTYMGGSLNITCFANNSWSQFPNCVLSAQTTTVSSGSVGTCAYSPNLLAITNGYATYGYGLQMPTTSQAISGAYIDYVCMSPYTLVGNSRMMCANGSWLAQPVCSGKL
jgi:hypothetical protein